MTDEQEYAEYMETLSRLREESIDDPEAKEEYNKILESEKFQELEDRLTNKYATSK